MESLSLRSLLLALAACLSPNDTGHRQYIYLFV